MTRQEYIDAVKVKIEEISPFDEPESFIAAPGDPDYNNVKPIISYIDKSLDEAARNSLRALPLSLLHADIETVTPSITIAADGVGVISLASYPAASTRFVRLRHTELQRDITAFVTSEDPLYLVQQNKHTRGRQCKPVAVVSSDTGQMEIFSFAPSNAARTDTTNGRLLKINLDKKPSAASDFDPALTPAQALAQLVQSPIEEFIVLECARIVFNILEKYDSAKVCENEQAAKIQAILK